MDRCDQKTLYACRLWTYMAAYVNRNNGKTMSLLSSGRTIIFDSRGIILKWTSIFKEPDGYPLISKNMAIYALISPISNPTTQTGDIRHCMQSNFGIACIIKFVTFTSQSGSPSDDFRQRGEH